MLERFAELVTKRRTIVITAIALITLFFAYHMKNLKYENRMTHWFPQSDPVLKLLRETGDKFGTNELVMVAARPKSGGIFSPDFLQKLQSLTKELQEADHIFMVTSLTNMTQITRREWGLEVKDFLDDIPEEKGKLEELKSYALSQENYTDNVLSSDGEWTAMAVYIKPKGDTIAIFRDLIKPKVERYLADAAEILYSGIPSDSFYANEFTSANITRLVPAVVVLILAVLYFSFKSFRGVLYPTLVVGISSVWVFGLRGLLHWPMSLISPALPVFLVALGSAYGIHVVNKISFETRNEENKALKVRSAVSGIVIPVILTGVTTACGFASFATVKFTIVRDLGFFTAIGICFAVIISLTLIPSGYGLSSKKKKSFPPNQPALKFLPALSLNVRKYRVFILVFSAVVVLAFLFGIPHIYREIDFSKYFPQKSQPTRAFHITKDRFGGAYPLTIYFKSENTKSSGVLRAIRRAKNYLYSLEGINKPFSISDLIQELNFQLNNRYHIPEADRGVGNLWFFIEGRDEIRQILTEDLSESLVFSKASTSATHFMKDIHSRVRRFLDREFSKELKQYSLSALTETETTLLRRKETEYILEEIDWLARYYGDRTGIDLEKARNRLFDLLDTMPQSSDSDSLALIEKEFHSYIYAEYFDFAVEKKAQKKLYSRLIETAAQNSLSQEKILNILETVIPASEFENLIAEDVAKTLLYRVDEALRMVFAQRACSATRDLFPQKAELDADFCKKRFGLFYEIADNTVVLPSGVGRNIEGTALPIQHVEQSGHPATMTRLDFFLWLSQIQSLLLALVITFILMILIRRSILLGAISLTPIIFTLSVIYGFFGFTGIRLDFATMMTAGVSIGVGIDYSIHFIHSVVKAGDSGLNLEDAVHHAFLEKGRAIFANSIAVIAGFAVLILSTLAPLRDFGGIMVGSMFLAALSSLTVLPALILIIKPKIRSQK